MYCQFLGLLKFTLMKKGLSDRILKMKFMKNEQLNDEEKLIDEDNW
jgi:hypothetical protein